MNKTSNHRPGENLLLAALPREERKRLDPFLRPVRMDVGLSITVPDEPIEFVYFPYDAAVSTVQELTDGSSIETGLIGVEGLAGVQVWLRQHTTSVTTFVQIPGDGYRIKTEDFIREVQESRSPLNKLIAGYVHAYLVMTSMIAACNRMHSIEQRLCRWLRMTYNRANRREYPLRQEFLAQMLGVHRPTVSIAANRLQKAGLIDYKYGTLKITNAVGLLEGACECYHIMEYQLRKF